MLRVYGGKNVRDVVIAYLHIQVASVLYPAVPNGFLTGPCGGSKNGQCEIGEDIECAWQLIINRLKVLGRLDDYENLFPIKNWASDRGKGPRVMGIDKTRP